MSRLYCLNCRFYEPRYADDSTVGYCRRFPPHGSGRMISDWAFPMVRRSDWCGEWTSISEERPSITEAQPRNVVPERT